jgi:hypothetical protein
VLWRLNCIEIGKGMIVCYIKKMHKEEVEMGEGGGGSSARS